MLFWCCFAQAWDGGSPVFFLQRFRLVSRRGTVANNTGNPCRKTRKLLQKNKEPSQTTPVQVGKTQLSGNTLLKQSQKTTALATARTTALTTDSFGNLWGVESPYQGRAPSEVWYLWIVCTILHLHLQNGVPQKRSKNHYLGSSSTSNLGCFICIAPIFFRMHWAFRSS